MPTIAKWWKFTVLWWISSDDGVWAPVFLCGAGTGLVIDSEVSNAIIVGISLIFFQETFDKIFLFVLIFFTFKFDNRVEIRFWFFKVMGWKPIIFVIKFWSFEMWLLNSGIL